MYEIGAIRLGSSTLEQWGIVSAIHVDLGLIVSRPRLLQVSIVCVAVECVCVCVLSHIPHPSTRTNHRVAGGFSSLCTTAGGQAAAGSGGAEWGGCGWWDGGMVGGSMSICGVPHTGIPIATSMCVAGDTPVVDGWEGGGLCLFVVCSCVVVVFVCCVVVVWWWSSFIHSFIHSWFLLSLDVVCASLFCLASDQSAWHQEDRRWSVFARCEIHSLCDCPVPLFCFIVVILPDSLLTNTHHVSSPPSSSHLDRFPPPTTNSQANTVL